MIHLAFTLQLLAQDAPTPLMRLNSEQRMRLFSSLGVLVILGIVLICFVWFAGRAVRRYVQHDPTCLDTRLLTELDLDDWARNPLIPKFDATASDATDPESSSPDAETPEGEP